MNLYKKVNEWLKQYEPFYNNWIYFNATPYVVGSVAMNAVSGDRIVREYITGVKAKQLTLAIDFVKEYDAVGTSDVNIDIMEELENFSSWIEQNNIVKNFPDFGEFNFVQELEVLTNVPSLLIDSTQQLAKYQIQFRINYNDESEVY